jgi:hypothetical protein
MRPEDTKSFSIGTEQTKKNGDEQTRIQDRKSGQIVLIVTGTWKGETLLLAELPDGGESNRAIQMNV